MSSELEAILIRVEWLREFRLRRSATPDPSYVSDVRSTVRLTTARRGPEVLLALSEPQRCVILK